MTDRVILDLCGGSGAWSAPYRAAGYDVRLVDLPDDVRTWKAPAAAHGVLCAPPCTVFSYARNRYPPTEAEFNDGLSIVNACKAIAIKTRPKWWALENPLNKLRRWLGPPQWIFERWEYGDPGRKLTALWGDFEPPMFTPKPFEWGDRWKQKENAVPADAVTPPGFAQAFFEANP